MLKEKAEKEIASWVEYYTSQVNRIKEYEPDLLLLTEALDKFEIEEKKVSLTYDTVEVTFDKVEEARNLVSKLLQEAGFNEFSKSWTAVGDRIIWGYFLSKPGISIRINPCLPNQDCIPTQKVSTYTSWICEKAR
jgi:hypothetical protein